MLWLWKSEGPFSLDHLIQVVERLRDPEVGCPWDIPPFNADEIHKYLKKIDGWQVLEDKIDGFHLIKSFKFDNFLKSQEFVNKVGEIAESEGHHPDLWFGWGRLVYYTIIRDGIKLMELELPN